MKDDNLNISEYAKKLILMVDKEGEQDRVMRVREWVLNWMFYRDVHYGSFNSTGQFQVLPDADMEDLRYTSDFMFSIETIATQWTQSSPELSLDPASDANNAKSVTRHAEKELEPYRERYWTDVFKQSMSKFAMLSTCYFINTRPKLNPDVQVKVPKHEQKQVSSPKTFYCDGCGAAATESDAGEKCPQCGSEMASSPGYDADVPVPSGLQSMPDVDCEVELVDPTEIKIDPKCRAGSIAMADWMRRERYLRDYEAEALHPEWQQIVDTAASSSERSDVLEYKRGLEQSIGGWAIDQTKESGRVLQRQYWFDSKVYKNRPPFKHDEEYGGQKFKAGEKLIDRFPDGWYIEQFNGKAVALFNEDKNSRWVGGVDTVDPTSPYGRGRSGLRNLQEMKDEGVSLGFAYLMRAVLGTSIYDPLMVEASDYADNRVGGAMPLKVGAQLDGRTIDQAVFNVPYQSLNAGFMQEFLTIIDDAMPKAGGGSYDVLGGGTGEGAGQKTLGGQTQQLQTSAGMVGPALQLRTEAEIEAFYQYLELRQQYGSEQSFMKVAGSWGDADAEAFRNCRDDKGNSTIRETVKITSVQNSEIPRTQMDRRNDVALAIQSGVANPQLPMLPGVRKYGLEQLRIPIEDDADEQSKQVAESLLEKMKQAAKYAQQMSEKMGVQPDPNSVAQAIASVAKLVKQRDDGSLPVFKQVFQQYLRSAVDSEGIDADQSLQLAVMLKIDEIEQFDVAMAADLSAKQVMAQAPGVMAEKAMSEQGGDDPNAQAGADQSTAEHAAGLQAQQADQQAGIQTDQNQQQALLAAHNAEIEQQGKAADQSENDKARAHEVAMSAETRAEAARERAHQLEMAKHAAAKVKSQPKKLGARA